MLKHEFENDLSVSPHDADNMPQQTSLYDQQGFPPWETGGSPQVASDLSAPLSLSPISSTLQPPIRTSLRNRTIVQVTLTTRVRIPQTMPPVRTITVRRARLIGVITRRAYSRTVKISSGSHNASAVHGVLGILTE